MEHNLQVVVVKLINLCWNIQLDNRIGFRKKNSMMEQTSFFLTGLKLMEQSSMYEWNRMLTKKNPKLSKKKQI